MHAKPLDREIDAIRRRLGKLKQRACASPQRRVHLTESVEALGVALESLLAAAQAVREQQDELIRTGAVVEAERQRYQEMFFELKRAEQQRERNLDRLNRLIRISTQVVAAKSLDGLLDKVAVAARELTGARMSVSGTGYEEGVFRVGAGSSEGVMPQRPDWALDRGGIHMSLMGERDSIRLTSQQMASHPLFASVPADHPPVRGILGARLIDRQGRPNGLLMVSDKAEGDFTEEDEALLTQLATITSLAMQHVEARTDAEARAQEAEKGRRTLERTEKERERLLSQVEQHCAEMDAAFEAIADGLVLYSPAGKIVRINKAAQAVLGLSPAHLEMPLADRLSGRNIELEGGRPLAGPQDTATMRAVRGETVRGQLEGFNRPGEEKKAWVSVSAAPIRTPDGRILGAVSTFTDITGLRDTQQRLEEANRELERVAADLARSNKDLDQFASIAAHDLRQPLMSIQTAARLLETRHAAQWDDKAQKLLHLTLDAANVMSDMIKGLLTYARAGSQQVRLQVIDCERVLAQTVHNLGGTIEATSARVTHDPLPTIVADDCQLMLLLQNLIENGIKYRGPEPPHVHVSATDSGQEYHFTVRDNGIGIEPQYLQKVFEIFWRAQDQVEGSGVGLAICARIVDRHHGHIWVESEIGRGSTFHFTLPQNGQPLSVPAPLPA